jgi:hypothetical protein
MRRWQQAKDGVWTKKMKHLTCQRKKYVLTVVIAYVYIFFKNCCYVLYLFVCFTFCLKKT